MGTVEKVEGRTTTHNKKSGKIQEKFHQGEVEKIDTKVFMESLKNPKIKDSKREKDDVVAFLRRQNRQSPTYQIHLGTK